MRKLRPGQVRLLTVVLAVLTLLLVPLGMWADCAWMFYAGLICYILVVLVWFVFHRCPHCRRHLGRSTSLYCPHCGKKL